MRRTTWSLYDLPIKQSGKDIGCQVRLPSRWHGRCIDEALFRPGGGRLPCRRELRAIFCHCLQQRVVIGMLDNKRRLDEGRWNDVRDGEWFIWQVRWWKPLLPGGLPDPFRFAPANAGEALLLGCVWHSRYGQTHTHDADLGISLKGAFLAFGCPVGELPHPHLIIPSAP